jgi:hypothetical protein
MLDDFKEESVQKNGLKSRHEKMSILSRDEPPEQGGHNECGFAKVSMYALQSQIHT